MLPLLTEYQASPSSASSDTKRPTFKMPPSSAGSGHSSQGSAKDQRKPSPPKFNPPKSLSKRPSPEETKPKFNIPKGSTRPLTPCPSDRNPLVDANESCTNSQLRDKIDKSVGVLELDNAENIAPILARLQGAEDFPIALDGPDTDVIEIENVLQEPCGAETSLDPCVNLRTQASQNEGSAMTSSPYDPPGMTKCRFCGTLIDKAWFEEVAGTHRLSMRRQAEICHKHKIRTGCVEWREKGFPEIQWHIFDERLCSYHPQLDDLLQSSEPSFYRNLLQDTVRSGKNRTLRQTVMQSEDMGGLVPGYYGSRGAKAMVDNIIARYSSKLRRMGHSDKLISTSGVSGYVQAVLAPELAVMLVMDDMRTDQHGAREILRESVEIGNLLNEEEDEFIAHDPDVQEIQI